MIFVFGGSGSGKSEYAEERAVQLARQMDLPLYYIATMKAYGREDEEKIARHRRLRAGKGFITIEKPVDIGEIDESYLRKYKDKFKAAALLECVSNLTANEMFTDAGIVSADAVSNKVSEDIKKLNMRFAELVIVSDDIFSDGMDYDETTRQYAAALARINRFLAKEADEVVEAVAGIPLRLK